MPIKAYKLKEWLRQNGISEEVPLIHILNNSVFNNALCYQLLCGNKFLFITRCGVTDEMLIAFEDVSDD